jgi:hypothetical protein
MTRLVPKPRRSTIEIARSYVKAIALAALLADFWLLMYALYLEGSK